LLHIIEISFAELLFAVCIVVNDHDAEYRCKHGAERVHCRYEAI
jgi:hypothetical protein